MRTINVAQEFSRHPAGRYLGDGPFSGQAFRTRYLVPAIRSNERVIIELDGVRGYGSSFLEEAFGGLVRAGFSAASIKEHFEFKTDNASLREEILEYIDHGNEPEKDE